MQMGSGKRERERERERDLKVIVSHETRYLEKFRTFISTVIRTLLVQHIFTIFGCIHYIYTQSVSSISYE